MCGNESFFRYMAVLNQVPQKLQLSQREHILGDICGDTPESSVITSLLYSHVGL